MSPRFANQPESPAQRAARLETLVRAAQQAGHVAGQKAHPGNNPPYNLQQDILGARTTSERHLYLREYRTSWIKGMTARHARYGDAYWHDRGKEDGSQGYDPRFKQLLTSSGMQVTDGQRAALRSIYMQSYKSARKALEARLARLYKVAEHAAYRDAGFARKGRPPTVNYKVFAPGAQSQYESDAYWSFYRSMFDEAMDVKNG